MALWVDANARCASQTARSYSNRERPLAVIADSCSCVAGGIFLSSAVAVQNEIREKASKSRLLITVFCIAHFIHPAMMSDNSCGC